METKYRPLSGHILVKEINENITESGIVLDKTNNDNTIKCTVISKGAIIIDKETDLDELSINVDDTVIIPIHSGRKITIDDEKYIVVKISDVLINLSNNG